MGVDPQGAERGAEGNHRAEHAGVGATRQEELLVRDGDHHRAITEEREQPVQCDARGRPRRHEQQ